MIISTTSTIVYLSISQIVFFRANVFTQQLTEIHLRWLMQKRSKKIHPWQTVFIHGPRIQFRFAYQLDDLDMNTYISTYNYCKLRPVLIHPTDTCQLG